MTVVGTRPEIIKLSRVLHELDTYTNHILVHTGQNYDYELNEIFFKELEIKKPDYFLNTAGENAAETIGNVISKSDEIFEKEKPDALLILGDTNSCLCTISAKRKKIPIFHMEAGNRSFDEKVPEEINRRIIDHISDINLPYTEHARRYLISEGIKSQMIIKTGSPMKEILMYYMPSINASDVMSRLKIKENDYFVFSSHREENVENEENFNDLLDTLNDIARKYSKPIIVTTHPRIRRHLEGNKNRKIDKRVRFLNPLGLFDYVKLQMHAYCVISDSGTITEESSILNFPAVTIRYSHERPEGMDEGVLIMCGLKAARVIESIDIVVSQYSRTDKRLRIVEDYDVENVSKKVLRTIMSYTDYVNRFVWQK